MKYAAALALALALAAPAAKAQSTNERCGLLWSTMQVNYNDLVQDSVLPGWEELEEAGFNSSAQMLVSTVTMQELFGAKAKIAGALSDANAAYRALECEW